MVWPSIHKYQVKTVTEKATFQKRCSEWKFKKRKPSSCSRVDGWHKRQKKLSLFLEIWLCHKISRRTPPISFNTINIFEQCWIQQCWVMLQLFLPAFGSFPVFFTYGFYFKLDSPFCHLLFFFPFWRQKHGA